MRAPRRRSRPNRPASQDAARAHDARGEESISGLSQEAGSAASDGTPEDDPGRLIEQTFLASASVCDADELILAWMALLPRELPPPQAARRLCARLRAQVSPPLAAHQQRLLELLEFVAKHRERADTQ